MRRLAIRAGAPSMDRESVRSRRTHEIDIGARPAWGRRAPIGGRRQFRWRLPLAFPSLAAGPNGGDGALLRAGASVYASPTRWPVYFLVSRPKPPSYAAHDAAERLPCVRSLHAQQHGDDRWTKPGSNQPETFGGAS